jgi:hypothetical protein
MLAPLWRSDPPAGAPRLQCTAARWGCVADGRRFCGDKPLPAATWADEVRRLGVLVIEAQSLAILLGQRPAKASLADVDMLVSKV